MWAELWVLPGIPGKMERPRFAPARASTMKMQSSTTCCLIGTVVDTLPLCSQPIGNVVPQVIALQQQFQQATAQAGAQANGGYVANALAAGAAVTGVTLYAPNYQSPRSYQMNVGVQRQLKPGTVVSVDYLRNVGVHTLLAIDENHVGDPRFLDTAGASAAIGATLGMCGATS